MGHARARGAVGAAALAALAGLAAGCGGARQDADEPSGQFRVQVTAAHFPARQALSQPTELRIAVRNADHRSVPDVAVTVQTRPKGGDAGAAPEAFGAAETSDTTLADNARPIWILDSGPAAGQTAYVNTWALGTMSPGETKTFKWRLLPVKAGRYTVSWRVFPGLDGKAKAAHGERVHGAFAVTISNRPVPARVDDNGKVVRGQKIAAR
jgi:hypothetical protein